MPIQDSTRHEAWNWQCWKTFKTKPDVWIGFFESDKDALAWVKTQQGTFAVNNVPPSGRTASGRKFEGWSTPLLDDVNPIPVRTFARPSDTSDRKTFQVAPKVVKPKRALTAEEKALKAEAEALYAQHKADEAAELETT